MDGYVADSQVLPPVQFDDVVDPARSEVGGIAQWYDENRCVLVGQLRQRRQVHVVVVVVAYEDGVNWRQIRERNAWLAKTPRPGPGQRTGAIRPDRIGQNIYAAGLDQHSCMIDKSAANSIALHTFRRSWAAVIVSAKLPMTGLASHAPSQKLSKCLYDRFGILKPRSVEIGCGRPVMARCSGGATGQRSRRERRDNQQSHQPPGQRGLR